MAYREPESSIYLLKGCPCDHEYNNTILFETKGAQWNYMKALMVRSFTNQYYQRYNRGVLRIQARTEDLYECNYLVFSNDPRFNIIDVPSDDMKIFYCFIDSIAYINENVTEVHYTIDVMQTYMFDYTLGYCFIEREHTISDNFRGNRMPEDFAGADYYYRQLYQFNVPTESLHNPAWYVLVKYVPNTLFIALLHYKNSTTNEIELDVRGISSYNNIKGQVRNGCYTGARHLYIPLFATPNAENQYWNIRNIETVVNEIVNDSGTVVEMSLIPAQMAHNNVDVIAPEDVADAMTYSYENTISCTSGDMVFRGNNGDSYTAKNKKMLQAPYREIVVTNNEGTSIEYSWEDFEATISQNSTVTVNFKLKACVNANAEMVLYPYNYNGIEDNYKEAVQVQLFPSISWNEDSFARMWSENSNKIISGLMAAAMGMLNGALKGAGVGVKYGGAKGAVVGAVAGGILGGASAASTAMTENTANTAIQPYHSKERINIQSLFPSPSGYVGLKDSKMLGQYTVASMAVASLLDATRKRDIINGQQSGSQNPILLGKFGFTIWERTIKPYYAKQIDSYFSMFGYKINELKIPNLHMYGVAQLRPHWNYIKNVDTVVLPYDAGNNRKRYIPEDAESVIKMVYNKGITFWMNGEEVGDYSLDNSPVTQI